MEGVPFWCTPDGIKDTWVCFDRTTYRKTALILNDQGPLLTIHGRDGQNQSSNDK